jgi:hypothetical protein
VGLLGRLLGRQEEPQRVWQAPTPQWQPSAPTSLDDLPVQFAHVLAGNVVINAAIYLGYPKGEGAWTDGIRLEDPNRGGMLYRDDDYPDAWIEAGVRDIAVRGIPYHPDAQRPEFGVGRYVRLVPEPTNRKDRRAIAVRSVDGSLLAGYVPADRLDELWSMRPPPQAGLVSWDHYLGPFHERVGIYVLAAPTIELRMVPPQYVEQERARREAVYAAGGLERMQEAQEQEAERQARAAARVRERERKDQAKAAKLSLEATRRVAGLCLICGGPIDANASRGRHRVRCEACRIK